MAYVQNRGQWPAPVRYRARLADGSVLLEDGGWTLLGDRGSRGAAVRMRLEGHATAALAPEAPLPARHHYFVGRDPARWRADVPLFGAVRYRQPYPGVDVLAYSVDGHFEYDLLLSPGTDLEAVRFAVEGASALRLDEDGALIAETPIGPLRQPPPQTWQTSDSGERRLLVCRHVLLGDDRFGFEVLGWDRELPLTVDPGVLWSTYLGGNGSGQGWDDVVRAVSVDGAGIVTVAGTTASLDFPTTPGGFNPSFSGGNSDAFVSRLDPTRVGGNQLLYSTFFGGDGSDSVDALWVDPATGVLTLAGSTGSATTFPTSVDAFATAYAGGTLDAFVTRLDPAQTGAAQLVYSTFLGGEGLDRAVAIAVDAAGLVTIAGYTASLALPTTLDVFGPVFGGGAFDVFVSRLDPSLQGTQQLLYSTYLGAGDADVATATAVDSAGVVTVVGSTTSFGFPTTSGAFSEMLQGLKDAFVSQLDPSRSGPAQLVYSTLLGGTGSEQANAVALDQGRVVAIAGITDGNGFPTTPGAFDATFNGGPWDIFVAELDPAGTAQDQLRYATLFGGTTGDFGLDLAVDSRGTLTVAGEVGGFQSNFPTTAGAFDTTFGGGGGDAYVIRLDPARSGSSQLVYSTFLGGPNYERALALSLDLHGVTLAGGTNSTNFPTTAGAFDRTYNGGVFDGFATRLDLLPTGVLAYGRSTTGCTGPLRMSVNSVPVIGNAGFTLLCDDAPPGSSSGFAILAGAMRSPPIVIHGAEVWVGLGGEVITLSATSNARGASDVALPLPAAASLAGVVLFSQFFWMSPTAPPPCPPLGLSASQALKITIQS